ncbi:MAG: sigma-70 family RNA polymerase sigma factor [Bacteroidetes bacterium]|nr:MAG: sigma-70 family RNA polymerase sigma factor [Bacteroidota bacterium]
MIKSGSRATYTDAELMAGIQSQDRAVLRHIYRQHYPLLRAWITRNQGDAEAARDIFQETMMVMFEKAHSPDFQLSHTFQSYLMGVGKNLWLMQLRRRRQTGTVPVDLPGPDLGATIAQDLQQHDRYTLYRAHFARLGDTCQQVLRWFLDGVSLREIGQRLNTTEAYAKKRKFLCQKQLIESIEADPRYRELTE